MSLVDHAKRELELAGFFDDDSDYNGLIGHAALALVELFASQGHSGGSAAITLDVTGRLLRYEPLTALTYAADEWDDRSQESGYPLWQNRRDPRVMSSDNGETHWIIGGGS